MKKTFLILLLCNTTQPSDQAESFQIAKITAGRLASMAMGLTNELTSKDFWENEKAQNPPDEVEMENLLDKIFYQIIFNNSVIKNLQKLQHIECLDKLAIHKVEMKIKTIQDQLKKEFSFILTPKCLTPRQLNHHKNLTQSIAETSLERFLREDPIVANQ